MSDWIKIGIVAGLVVTYIVVIAGLFTWTIPLDNRDIAYMVIGGLTANLTTIVNYFLGSSRGSQAKDDTINKLAGGQ